MTTLLAGDIGGTKTILRLVHSELTATREILPHQTVLYERSYFSREFSDLVPMVRQFLELAIASLGTISPIEKACFGIAGPVVNNTSELTNLNWFLSSNNLEQDLNIPQVELINDFAAIGYGILGLSADDLYILQDGNKDKNAPIAVLGAGTGLGEGFLIPLPNGNYQVFASEGSHADFAPRSSLEFQLLNYLCEKNNLERVSVERVVSGIGIVAIYQFLYQQNPSQESSTLGIIRTTWEREINQEEKTVDFAAEISKAALSNNDYLCQQTMQLFIKAYGAEAGNLALKLLPYGGLYIAGGIAPKILPLLQQGQFMTAFKAKGRMTSLMQRIPVYIVTNPKVGLIGAALFAGS